MSFNVLVTHEPGRSNYRHAVSELRRLIGEVVVVDTAPSVILIKVRDPYEAIGALLERASEITPVIYRIVPIDLVLNPFVEDVAEAAWKLAEERIPREATYRVTLHGRLYWRETRMPASSRDAIEVIARNIARKVSLTSPDYQVYVRSVRLYHRKRVAALAVAPTRMFISLRSGKP
ncbi:MAG: THUMP domain-containing protein [Desulfurococcaceae archaeon]